MCNQLELIRFVAESRNGSFVELFVVDNDAYKFHCVYATSICWYNLRLPVALCYSEGKTYVRN